MVVIHICKRFSDRDLEKVKRFKKEMASLHTLNKKFDYGVNIASSSELIRSWPLIRAVEQISDLMNLYKQKIYYHMSDYVTSNCLIHDFKNELKSKTLKRELSI